MHELSLMEALRDQALAAARGEGVRRIALIRLRVGELAGVEVEALRFAFPVVMAGHDRRPRTSRFALPAAAGQRCPQ